MSLNQSSLRMNQSHRRGSSTMEFLFCAPALLIIMYVAMELNERLEQRVNSTIAAGNAAWISDPSNPSGGSPALESLVKADILGTKVTSSPGVIGASNDLQLTDSSAVMSYSESHRRADGYVAKVERSSGDPAMAKIKDRASAKIGNSSFDSGLAGFTGAVASVTNVADAFLNPGISIIPPLFDDNRRAEWQVVAWSLSSQGTTNLAINAIQKLSDSIGPGTANGLATFNQPESKILGIRSMALRRNAGFHPDQYHNQFMYGMALGSGTYSDFVDSCFMKFDDKLCGKKNGFYDYVAEAHAKIYTIKTTIDTIATLSSATPPGIAANIVYSTIVDELETVASDKIETKLKELIDTAMNPVNNMIAQMSSTLTNAEQKVMNKSNILKSKVKDQADEVLK